MIDGSARISFGGFGCIDESLIFALAVSFRLSLGATKES
jgi:hypothetical protein